MKPFSILLFLVAVALTSCGLPPPSTNRPTTKLPPGTKAGDKIVCVNDDGTLQAFQDLSGVAADGRSFGYPSRGDGEIWLPTAYFISISRVDPKTVTP